jgi:hypothetical protein
VVVLDGLGAHRTDRVRELIEERCRPYVPAVLLAGPQSHRRDVLEYKNIVRKAGARTREALVEAIALAISALTLEDVAGWFAHCGYHPLDQYS